MLTKPRPFALALALTMGALPTWASQAGASLTATPAALSTAAAQAEIQVIRKALIDEALDGPTRVRAWAWVDERGALHERNEVAADMQVRGVRVREYLGGKKESIAGIQAQMAKSQTGQCRYAQGHWRVPMSVEVDISAVRLADLRAVALNSVQVAQATWSDALQVGKRYQTAARQVESLNPYQRALLGAVDSEAGWRAVWSVQASEVAQLPMGYIAPERRTTENHPAVPNVADLVLRLEVMRERRDGRHATREAVWSRSLPMRVELMAAGWSQPRLTVQSLQQLNAVAQSWAQDLEQLVACQPLQYDVTDVRSQSMRINAGTSAGLQVGDRVVVMDAATVGSQVWDTGTLEKVAIARVQRVDAYGAYVRTVAGQMPAADGRLVALPY